MLSSNEGVVLMTKEISYRFNSYYAVLTALFPDRASGLSARGQLEAMAQPGHAIQWYEKDGTRDPWGDKMPGLEQGGVALIVHLADVALGEEAVSICLTAGASRARFYPIQQVC
jgi:hypothetical protein